MNKSLVFVFCFFLVACAPPTVVGPARLPTKHTTISPTALPTGTRIILRSSSLTLIVEDPAKALSALERAVEEAGGFVVSASYYSSPDYPGYASLNAQVPPENLPELRRAAMAIASQVQSDSLYSQDVTSDFRRLHERLNQLHQSEDHLWQLATETRDHDLADSLTLLRDLIQQETLNVESQLLNYEDRSTLAAFDVTFNQTVQTQIIIE